jgi:hypothetical protein
VLADCAFGARCFFGVALLVMAFLFLVLRIFSRAGGVVDIMELQRWSYPNLGLFGGRVEQVVLPVGKGEAVDPPHYHFRI